MISKLIIFPYTFVNVGKNTNKVTAAGLVIALGIIYGDIGTSPLYVFNAIIGGRVISDQIIIGALSCIIWTLTLQTTIKYVWLVLKADNRGEGGTFALYAPCRWRRKKWLRDPSHDRGSGTTGRRYHHSTYFYHFAPYEGLRELPAFRTLGLWRLTIILL